MPNPDRLGDIVAIQLTAGSISTVLHEIGSHSTHANFLKYMTELTSECVQSYYTLDDIKSELRIAKENRAFDQINVIEIENNSKKLLAMFKSNREQNKKMKREIFSCKDGIASVKKRMGNKDITSTIASVLLRAATEGAVSLLATAGIANIEFNNDRMNGALMLSVAGGSITVASITHLINHCKVKKLFGAMQVLEKIQAHMTTLFAFADDFGVQTAKVVEELKDYTNRAEMNSKYHLESGERIVEQADKMIEKTEA